MTCGSPRAHAERLDRGLEVRVDRVARTTAENGLVAREKPKFRKTTDSEQAHTITGDASRLLALHQRGLTAAPGRARPPSRYRRSRARSVGYVRRASCRRAVGPSRPRRIVDVVRVVSRRKAHDCAEPLSAGPRASLDRLEHAGRQREHLGRCAPAAADHPRALVANPVEPSFHLAITQPQRIGMSRQRGATPTIIVVVPFRFVGG